jgi:hypothetical protein
MEMKPFAVTFPLWACVKKGEPDTFLGSVSDNGTIRTADMFRNKDSAWRYAIARNADRASTLRSIADWKELIEVLNALTFGNYTDVVFENDPDSDVLGPTVSIGNLIKQAEGKIK